MTSVGCRALTVDCRGADVGTFVGSVLSDIGYRVLAVDCCCRMSLLFPLSVPSSGSKGPEMRHEYPRLQDLNDMRNVGNDDC